MFFTCFYLFYSQIWLNNLVEDRQLSIHAVEPQPCGLKSGTKRKKTQGVGGLAQENGKGGPIQLYQSILKNNHY
jgi:hypothetical protein